MVNMNAAGDKQNIKNDTSNDLNQEVMPCSSAMCAENIEQVIGTAVTKLNGTGSENLPIANGAHPKTNTVLCSTPTACESSGSSTPRKSCASQISKKKLDNIQSTCEDEAKGSSSESAVDLHPDNRNCTNVQNQPKSKARQACKYDENSSSEDEECCIYTYKGDSNQMADFPSSFFRMDLLSSRPPNATSRNSSPDMDYLEMDFDPSPPNDIDSSGSSECGNDRFDDELLSVEPAGPSVSVSQDNRRLTPDTAMEPEANHPTPVSPLSTPSPVWNARLNSSPDRPNSGGLTWSPPISPQNQPSLTVSAVSSDGPPLQLCCCASSPIASVSIDENFNDGGAASTVWKELDTKTKEVDDGIKTMNNGDSATMIWKEEEAKEKAVTQIGTSLCGATAVINTLLALNIPYTVNNVKQLLGTRFRSESAPIPEYLMSRCNAGVTHRELIQVLQSVSQDLIYARFFDLYPQRNISLTSWLCNWIKKGAVPILTLNRQRNGSAEVVDYWHHQMVYGVSERGMHLTNPLETQSEAQLWPQLASPSLLLVRREDVLERWTPDTSLHPLIDPALPLWRRMNVLGQVVNVIREGKTRHCVQHITIPASYSSGVTLAMLRTNPACAELSAAPELPVDPFAPR